MAVEYAPSYAELQQENARLQRQNTRLQRELAEARRREAEGAEQQAATGAILRVIASSPTELQPVLDAIAESAARLCEATGVGINLVQGDRLVRAAVFGSIANAERGAERPLDRNSLTGRVHSPAARCSIGRCSTSRTSRWLQMPSIPSLGNSNASSATAPGW